MKTLDEIIKSVEAYVKLFEEKGCFDCHYCEDDCVKSCFLQDELHYLKEYKDLKSAMDWHKEMEEIRRSLTNDPLTWDELKAMKGKPVWVEDNIDEPEDLTKYWAIYRRIEKAQETEYALLCDLYYDKAEYGKSWQAYRKERG